MDMYNQAVKAIKIGLCFTPRPIVKNAAKRTTHRVIKKGTIRYRPQPPDNDQICNVSG